MRTTGAVLDTDDIPIPARFVDIDVDNAPASEQGFFTMKLQTICFTMSAICQEFATGAS